MIKKTLTFPTIPGLEVDNTNGDVKITVDSPSPYDMDCDWASGSLYEPTDKAVSTYTFELPGGAKIVITSDDVKDGGVIYLLTEEVELEKGKIYLLADRRQPNDKWLALCREERVVKWKPGKAPFVLVPIDNGMRVDKFPLVFARDKHNYTFYKEFDLDLKDYV